MDLSSLVLPAVPLVDTHCHLTNGRFDADREAVISGLTDHGVCRAITIGTGIADGEKVRALMAAHPDRLAGSVGLDPFSCHEAGADFAAHLAALERLLESGAFCAVGEIGLEYHHQVNPHQVQREQFAAQLEVAIHHNLPVVIHVREAHPDCLEVLRAHPKARGVIHSFDGDTTEVRAYLDLGWHISLNGMLGYKGNDYLREAAKTVPSDRLLVETDAPYLPPMPFRGRRNEPALMVATAGLLADLRGERLDDLAAWTTANACRLFKLPLPW